MVLEKTNVHVKLRLDLLYKRILKKNKIIMVSALEISITVFKYTDSLLKLYNN